MNREEVEWVAPLKVALGAEKIVRTCIPTHDILIRCTNKNQSTTTARRSSITLSFAKQFDTAIARVYELFYDLIKVARIQ
jgi:hypothetical protein